MSSRTDSGTPDYRRTALDQIKSKVLLSPEDLGRYRQLRRLHRLAAYQRKPLDVPIRPIRPSRPAADLRGVASSIIVPCLRGLHLVDLQNADHEQFQQAVEDAARRAQDRVGRPIDPEDPGHCVQLRREFVQSLTASRHGAVSRAVADAPFALRDRVRELLFHSMRAADQHAGRDPATWNAGPAHELVSLPDLILAMATTFLEAQDLGDDEGVDDARMEVADKAARARRERGSNSQTRSADADPDDERF